MPILRYLLLTSTLVFVALATADAQIGRIGIEVGPDLTQFRERFQGLTVTSDPRATLFVAAPIDFAIADKPLFVRLRPAFTSRASKYEEDGYEVFVGPNDIREVDIRAASGFRTAELGLSVGGELQRAGWTFGATTGLVPAYFLSQFAKVKGLEDYPEEEELFGLDSDGEDWEGIRRFELSSPQDRGDDPGAAAPLSKK